MRKYVHIRDSSPIDSHSLTRCLILPQLIGAIEETDGSQDEIDAQLEGFADRLKQFRHELMKVELTYVNQMEELIGELELNMRDMIATLVEKVGVSGDLHDDTSETVTELLH